MILNILKNGNENNICPPQKEGDVGFDLIAKSMRIKGEIFELDLIQEQQKLWDRYPEHKLNIREIIGEDICKLIEEKKLYSSIDYIEYDTGIVLEPEPEELSDGNYSKCLDNYWDFYSAFKY